MQWEIGQRIKAYDMLGTIIGIDPRLNGGMVEFQQDGAARYDTVLFELRDPNLEALPDHGRDAAMRARPKPRKRRKGELVCELCGLRGYDVRRMPDPYSDENRKPMRMLCDRCKRDADQQPQP